MAPLCELYPGICLTTEEKARKNKYIERTVTNRKVYSSWKEAQFNLWKHLAIPQIIIAHFSILDRKQQVDRCKIKTQHFIYFDVFSTVHHSIGLFLQPTLMHNSITTYMSHYYPRHVSGLDMPILRRNNCTNTASVILALNRCIVQPLRRARIPDAVFVQLFLLRMGMSKPETCRG